MAHDYRRLAPLRTFSLVAMHAHVRGQVDPSLRVHIRQENGGDFRRAFYVAVVTSLHVNDVPAQSTCFVSKWLEKRPGGVPLCGAFYERGR
jgi:hypothetical protein